MVGGKIVKVYGYTDAQGHPLFEVVRFEPKGFAQRRKFRGGFAWGLGEGWYRSRGSPGDYYKVDEDRNARPHPDDVWLEDVEPVLYNLPGIALAVQNGKTVFVCEGEKDADYLNAMGFSATTCPMGAGKWRIGYTETLKGFREVVILADKDEPGREHAWNIARSLFSVGVLVKMLEMPDHDGQAVNDFSDWVESGGKREEFEKMVAAQPAWEETNTTRESSASGWQEMLERYGEPYYLGRRGELSEINESFWAGLHQAEHEQLFEPDEGEFYRYDPGTGLYSIISTDSIKQEISSRMLEVSRQKYLPDLERKRTNNKLNQIVGHLKGISETRNAFLKTELFVHAGNGMIVFREDGEADLRPFSPDFRSRNRCPVVYDENARCDRFLKELLKPAVSPDDIQLIQKYTGLCLMGKNLAQRLLIIDGAAGKGKSTLAQIIQALVGQENVTQLRTRHVDGRFEMYRYLKKTLLVGVDVPGNFLSEKGAQLIKGLVGGDWFDAEQKGGTASFQFQGNFCILITSNSRLQIRLDGDLGAWRRRLLIVRFEGPPPAKKIPGFDERLIREEGSGILNWALRGLNLAIKELDDTGDIRLTPGQEEIVNGLLAESDSLRHFLADRVIRDINGDLSVQEIIDSYGEYCPTKNWDPKPITILQRELDGLMLEMFCTSRANSLMREGRSVRGYRRVAFKAE